MRRSGSDDDIPDVRAVVVYGVMFSLLLTLYVVPVVYGYIARNTQSPEYIAHLIEKLRGEKKPPAEAPESG